MEVEHTFRTPASRRSPAQIGKQRQEQDEGLVTKTFEAVKPFLRNALSNNGAWLTDQTCDDAVDNLGIVMPPIGYECELRTFREAEDVAKDPARDNGFNYDIYESPTTHDHDDHMIDQGTISNTTDNKTEKISNLNEFGFGYRNGYVFNDKNIHTQKSLLYLQHKHDSEKDILKMRHRKMTPLSGGRSGAARSEMNNNNYNYSYDDSAKYGKKNRYQPKKYQSEKILPHKYDTIEDVTAVTQKGGGSSRSLVGGRAGNRGGGGGFHSKSRVQKRFNNVDNELDEDGSGGIQNGKSNSLGFGGEEDTKESHKPRANSVSNGQSSRSNGTKKVNADPVAWMSRYAIFDTSNSQPQPTTEERRRESLVSEYSNYTPDGQQRQQRRLFNT